VGILKEQLQQSEESWVKRTGALTSENDTRLSHNNQAMLNLTAAKNAEIAGRDKALADLIRAETPLSKNVRFYKRMMFAGIATTLVSLSFIAYLWSMINKPFAF
jgi:hypothetical protein